MTELLSSMGSWRSTGDWILGMTVAAGLVLLVALVADLLLARRVSARWRSLLYLAVLIRLALPVEWASPVGLLGPMAVSQLPVATEIRSVVAMPAGASPAAASTPPRGRRLPVLAWLGGTALLAGGAIVARVMLARDVRRSRPACPRVQELVAGLELLEHDRLGPAAFGVFAPRIVVPTPLVGMLDDDALRGVLLHEAAHVRRRDPLRLMLLQAATFLAWPLLPAWLAAWRLRGLMEQACDEEALRDATAEQRRTFGHALLAVAAWRPLRSRFAVAMLPFGGGLRSRLSALRFTRRWPVTLQASVVVAAAVLPVLVLGARPLRSEPPAAPAAPTASSPEAIRLEQVPPIVRIKFEMFESKAPQAPRGIPIEFLTAAADDQPNSVIPLVESVNSPGNAPGLDVTFVPSGADDLRGTVIGADEVAALRAALSLSGKSMGEEHVHSAYLGAASVMQFRLNPDGDPDFARERVALFLNSSIRDGAFVADLAVRLGEAPMRDAQPRRDAEVVLREGDTIHLSALPSRERGAFHLLLTPENVRFDGAAPRVESSSVSLALEEATAEEAVKALSDATGLPIRVEGAVAQRISLSLDGVPAEEAIKAVAVALGLEPVMKHGMVVLAPAPPRAPPQTIWLTTTVWRVSRERAATLGGVAALVPSATSLAGHGSASLSRGEFDRLSKDLRALGSNDRADMVSHAVILTRLGERAQVETSRKDDTWLLRVGFVPTTRDSVPFVDADAGWTDPSGASSANASFALPGILLLSLSGGETLLFQVEGQIQSE